MKRVNFLAIIGGFAGFFIGLLVGGYLGLVLGGTFLGGFDIYEATGSEGYELATYAGAIAGAVALTWVGVRFGIKIANQPKKSEE